MKEDMNMKVGFMKQTTTYGLYFKTKSYYGQGSFFDYFDQEIKEGDLVTLAIDKREGSIWFILNDLHYHKWVNNEIKTEKFYVALSIMDSGNRVEGINPN
jgi:hypothetical protein